MYGGITRAAAREVASKLYIQDMSKTRITALAMMAVCMLLAWTSAQAGQVGFTNVGAHEPIAITPDKTTGLDMIYVVFDTQGVGMTYTPTSDRAVTWYIYGSQGGGYAEEITTGVTYDGSVSTLEQVTGDRGYIIEEGTDRTYIWVTNYADHYFKISSVDWAVTGCSDVSLLFYGSGEAIVYYSITGARQVLDREIEVSYDNMVWDDTTHWSQQTVVEKFESMGDVTSISQPLCQTTFLVSGDQFLAQWNLTEEAETQTFTPMAVGCEATAVQEERNNNNEKGSSDGSLGGSAPCHIVFTGYPAGEVTYRIWEMSTDEEFENVEMQFNQDEVDYTFTTAGTWYMRYMVANNDGSCEAYSETFTITVGESELVCPNVFSPGSTEGVNDVWKVSYKSLVEFHCWIFNRWGNLIYEFTDPGDGWDGTYRGKLVDTGTYYYVVTAVGSDGVKYKKRGDINILRWKQGSSSGGTTTDTTTE